LFCVVGHQRQKLLSAEQQIPPLSLFYLFPNAESVKGKNVFSTNSTLFLVLKTVSCFPFAFHFIIPKSIATDCPKEFYATQQQKSSSFQKRLRQRGRKGSKSNSHCWYNITFLFREIMALENGWNRKKKSGTMRLERLRRNVNRFFILI
jgi:hypothetical protein